MRDNDVDNIESNDCDGDADVIEEKKRKERDVSEDVEGE